MIQVYDLVGIPLVDHIILGRGEYFSFRENDVFPIAHRKRAVDIDEIKFSPSKVAEEEKLSVRKRLREKQPDKQQANKPLVKEKTKAKEKQPAL
jgi:hypothetical protein